MRVSISQQQRRLEEHETGVPHRGSSAKARQNHPAEHWLDEKKKAAADEEGQREDEKRDGRLLERGRAVVLERPRTSDVAAPGQDVRRFANAMTPLPFLRDLPSGVLMESGFYFYECSPRRRDLPRRPRSRLRPRKPVGRAGRARRYFVAEERPAGIIGAQLETRSRTTDRTSASDKQRPQEGAARFPGRADSAGP